MSSIWTTTLVSNAVYVSCPAVSTVAIWSVIVHSCIVGSCNFSAPYTLYQQDVSTVHDICSYSSVCSMPRNRKIAIVAAYECSLKGRGEILLAMKIQCNVQ